MQWTLNSTGHVIDVVDEGLSLTMQSVTELEVVSVEGQAVMRNGAQGSYTVALVAKTPLIESDVVEIKWPEDVSFPDDLSDIK